MTPTQALLNAYQTGDIAEIAEAEVAYMDAALAPYGDGGRLLHSEPPGYEDAFLRVMGEMGTIEDSAKGAA
jgi:hypothetical protein